MECIRCIHWQKEMGAMMCPMCAAEAKTVDEMIVDLNQRNWPDNAKKEVVRLRKALQLISGMCGTPNAADGCRNIMKFVSETLGKKEQEKYCEVSGVKLDV